MAIQVSIISAKLGSAPPAAAGFRCRMSPVVPHRVDDRRGQRPSLLGRRGLGYHHRGHGSDQFGSERDVIGGRGHAGRR